MKDRYKKIFDDALVGFFQFDVLKLKMIECNDAFSKMLGFDSIDLCHKRIESEDCIIPHEQRQEILKILKSIDDVGENIFEIRTKYGDTKWFHCFFRRNADLIDGIVIDITGQKRAEQSSLLSRKKSEEIFNSVQIGLAMVDLRTLEIVDVNPSFCDMLGMERNRILGLKCYSTLCGKKQSDCSYYSHAFSSLSPNKKSRKICIENRKTGITSPYLKTSVLVLNEDQMPVILESFVSLDEIEKAKGEAQSHYDRFKVLFDNSSEAIMILDSNGVIDSCNVAAAVLFGYRSPEEFVEDGGAKEIELYKENENLKKDVTSYAKECSSYGRKHFQAYHTKKDKSRFIGSVSVIPFKHQDQSGYQVIVHDITETKRHEKQLLESKILAERGNRAKSEFLANVSHELRTPLTPIIGWANTLQDEWDSEIRKAIETKDEKKIAEYKKILDSMNVSGKDLLRIINDILDISKIEAGKIDIKNTVFYLPDALHSVTSMLEKKATRKNLILAINGNFDKMDKCVTGDEDRIKQILLNLVSNAIKFTNFGYVYVIVNCIEKENSYDVEFAVVDSGKGIHKDQINRIFKPFEKIDEGDNSEGTGLGLAIVDMLVSRMSNKPVRVESEIGIGSKFSFELNMKFGDYYPECIEKEKKQPVEKRSEKINVLVAEDNEHTVELIKRVLDKYDCKYNIVFDGEEAIAAFLDDYYDLVLMDVRMPKMNGMEASKKIRSFGFVTPIIAYTASAMDSDKEECIASGMNGFIMKPMPTQESFIYQIRTFHDKYREASVDLEYAIKLHDGDQEFWKKGLNIYLDSAKNIISIYRKNKKDRKVLHSMFHSLKGEASQLGLRKANHIISCLVHKTNMGEMKGFEKLVSMLEKENYSIEKNFST